MLNPEQKLLKKLDADYDALLNVQQQQTTQATNQKEKDRVSLKSAPTQLTDPDREVSTTVQVFSHVVLAQITKRPRANIGGQIPTFIGTTS